MQMWNEYNDDDPLRMRVIAALGRWLRRMKKWWHWAILFGLFVVVTVGLLWFLIYLLGWDLSAIDDSQMRADPLYGLAPEHTDAYRWLDNKPDTAVSAHVIEARKNLNFTKWLNVVGTGAVELPVRLVECESELFSGNAQTTVYYNTLFHETSHFLENNRAAPLDCTCGVYFGRNIRHVAIYRNETAPDDHNRNVRAPVLHLLNVQDMYEREYDQLDETAMEGQKLAVVKEKQDFRYNGERRGVYAIVRRKMLRLDTLDRQCHQQVIQVFDRLAFCVQRCLDTMRGIDVRERARMQYRSGIKLNAALFARTHSDKTEL